VKDVFVEDQNGTLYPVVGAERSGGSMNAQTGGSQSMDHKFQIKGATDSLNTSGAPARVAARAASAPEAAP
jgi:hypothetical protein